MKLIDWILGKPHWFFGVSFITFATLIAILDIQFGFYGNEDWKGVLTEAHGMILDILVFGILVSIYEGRRQKNEKQKEEQKLKQEKIDRYLEEIDDLRKWKDPEATYKIIGNIKRLNNLGVNKIDLSNCFLKNANLREVNLSGSKFLLTNLEHANLEFSTFYEADFDSASLVGAKIIGSNFDSAKICDTDLDTATIVKSNFSNARFFRHSRYGTINGIIVDEMVLSQFKIKIKEEEEESVDKYHYIDKKEEDEILITYPSNISEYVKVWRVKGFVS